MWTNSVRLCSFCVFFSGLVPYRYFRDVDAADYPVLECVTAFSFGPVKLHTALHVTCSCMNHCALPCVLLDQQCDIG